MNDEQSFDCVEVTVIGQERNRVLHAERSDPEVMEQTFTAFDPGWRGS
jgi:hypothetical protein